MFSSKCKEHLDEVGMTGSQHMKRALKSAVLLQMCVPALVLHSIAPRYFPNTASNIMRDILSEVTNDE
jgi:hypothetical protein